MGATELPVEIRTRIGKGESSKMRREGYIPAVLYGPGAQPQAISVNQLAWQKVLRASGNRLSFLNLRVKDNGGDSLSPAIVKAIQRHPVNESIVHIDFQRVSLSEKMVVEVPVTIEGVAPGTKLGAILQQPVRTIAISCLPTDIPQAAIADVSHMEVGHVLNAGELKLPSEVELQTDPGTIVVSVAMVYMREEETAAPEAAAAEVPAQPEVIGEKERDERRLKKGEDKDKRETEKVELKEALKQEEKKK